MAHWRGAYVAKSHPHTDNAWWPGVFLIIPTALGQFITFGQGYGVRNRGYGGFVDGGFYGNRGSYSYGGARSYYVRGRLLCGIQSQAARIILWENRGAQPYIYEETMTDMTGYFRAKAELNSVVSIGVGGGSTGGWNGFSNGNLMLTINHNCDVNVYLR
ncbi:hypothetical protein KIN20_028581 [Parelaphostrongylus tenuis]|uniref:Uncharacterized protein n=1 Tax=Parelaphostrongylus tenuis TaxID=148309 RepID=A0AAD5R1D1_PARTN|nr:hypothetical protein KIN20_028581 [Parelaphostrongylus tenuis]